MLKMLLILSIILLGLGAVIIAAGLFIASGYNLAVCQVGDSKYIFNADGNEYIGQIWLEYNTTNLNLAEWINIYTQLNSTLVVNYINTHYPIGSNLACYVSNSYIVLFLNIRYSTGVAGMISISLSLLVILIYGIANLITWKKRRGYRDLDTELHQSVDREVIVIDDSKNQVVSNIMASSVSNNNNNMPNNNNNNNIPNDNRMPSDNNNTTTDKYATVLSSFEEAQSLLWQYRSQIKEVVFNKLRYKQVEAITGNEASKKKFQRLVYDTLAAI